MWIVGITDTCEFLRAFDTYKSAVKFIDTLPDADKGIYYLDKASAYVSARAMTLVGIGYKSSKMRDS